MRSVEGVGAPKARADGQGAGVAGRLTGVPAPTMDVGVTGAADGELRPVRVEGSRSATPSATASRQRSRSLPATSSHTPLTVGAAAERLGVTPRVVRHLVQDVRPDELPAFLRVEEVARILRISRSAAYELANAWLATGGEAGLPAVRLGRTVRIPRAAVERLLNVGGDGVDV